MAFLWLLIVLYVLFVITHKSDTTWKIAFRDGTKSFLFSVFFFLCTFIAISAPLLLVHSAFGEGSYWANALGGVGGITAFLAFAALVSRKFPFF